MDLLAMTDGTRLMVSNSFEPVVEISLPLAELRKLAFGAQYSYDIQDVSLDVKPGKIGVSLKLIINSEYKVSITVPSSQLCRWVKSVNS